MEEPSIAKILHEIVQNPNNRKTPKKEISEDPEKYEKIRNKFAHKVNESTNPYTGKNAAKWTRMFIKAALLLNLADVANEMESLLYIYMRRRRHNW